MNNHTPGPWHTNNRKTNVYGTDERIVACCDYQQIQPASKHANARLIAAAPDLLAALENAVVLVSHTANEQRRTPLDVAQAKAALQIIHAAIAKAKGAA